MVKVVKIGLVSENEAIYVRSNLVTFRWTMPLLQDGFELMYPRNVSVDRQ